MEKLLFADTDFYGAPVHNSLSYVFFLLSSLPDAVLPEELKDSTSADIGKATKLIDSAWKFEYCAKDTYSECKMYKLIKENGGLEIPSELSFEKKHPRSTLRICGDEGSKVIKI